MSLTEVLVSYSLDREKRDILAGKLREVSEVRFLSDVAEPDRPGTIERAEVIISWSPAGEFSVVELKSMRNLRLLQTLTAGVDHVPFSSMPEGLLIAANVGAFAEPMAEHILGMALALTKRLCQNNTKLAKGEFDQKTHNRMLRGLTLGVLGFGGIGQAAARLMRLLGLRIFAVNSTGRTSEAVDYIGTLDDLEHVLKSSDLLLVSIPLSKRTRNLIRARELGMMKPDAILINVSRGAIIDEGDLYRHLAENSGFSAAIDAWWIEPSMGGDFRVNYPFFDLPNFLGSPHNSPIVPGILQNALELAGENVARFLKGGEARGIVRREDYVEE